MGNGVYRKEEKMEEIKIGVISENTRDFLEKYYTGRKLKILERALNRRDIDALKEIRNDPTLMLVYGLLRTIRDEEGNYVKNEDGKLVYAFTKREVELFKKRFAELEKKKVPVFIAEFEEEKAQRGDLYGQQSKKTGKKVVKSGKEQREINFGPDNIAIDRPELDVNKILTEATKIKEELDEEEVKKRLELFAKAIEQVTKTKSGNEEDKKKVKKAFEDFANWAIGEMKKEEEEKKGKSQKGNIRPEAKVIDNLNKALEELRKKYPIFEPKKNNNKKQE